MARRADLFVRELIDGEAAHLLKQARRGKNAVVHHRAMFLFAEFLALVDEMLAPGGES